MKMLKSCAATASTTIWAPKVSQGGVRPSRVGSVVYEGDLLTAKRVEVCECKKALEYGVEGPNWRQACKRENEA